MKNNRMTLQDIANLVGLNKMTVSRYLRDPQQVSQKSRDLLSKVLEEINYIPNRAPEILMSARSKTIGIVIPSFRNQIFSDVLAGIESVASANNYQTLIANYEYDLAIEEQKIINLLSYNIDAIVLTGKTHTKRAERYLKSTNIPIAELMDITPNCLDIQVGFDNEKAAYDMAQALIAKNKRKIVFLGSMDDPRDASRYRGVCRALKPYGIEPDHLVPHAISSIQLGRQMVIRAQKEIVGFDALFCTNDDLAIGALLECQAQGIRIPEKIAIAGFHGLEIGQANSQKVASVITPRFDIGKIATEQLIQRLSGNKNDANSIQLGYQIYLGDTV